jgi:hypothetical protein
MRRLTLTGVFLAAFCAQGAVITNSSFELTSGGPATDWNDTSLNFGFSRCTAGSCGLGGGTAGPNTGDAWIWFGGISSAETSSVSQANIIPVSASAGLTFYTWLGNAATTAPFSLVASIDGNPLLTLNNTSPVTAGYQFHSFDISSFANGLSHTIAFNFNSAGGGNVNISLDDVDITLRGVAEVPEPSTFVFGASALLGLGLLRRRM